VAVAQRMYARALFEAAKEQGRLAEAREELDDFVTTAREVPELRALLENPQVDPRAKRVARRELLAEGDELVRNFLLLVVEKGRAAELEEIQREFDELVAAEEQRLTVELTTAYELSEDEARDIVRQIEQASGRRVDANRKVDSELIGGLVLQAGSLRVDASVRGRLERLRRELSGGASVGQ
jgi:F-type H+-transporting ATPase subunit delta